MRGRGWRGLGLGVLVVLAGVGAVGVGVGRAQARPPIKIGVLYPFTGPYAFLGEHQLLGLKLAFEQRGNRIAGREVQIITEDDQGRPETGVTKVRKLIEQDKVHVLAGIVSSAVAYAVREWVERSRVPLVITMANAGELTRSHRSPYLLRTFQPGGAPSYYMGRWIHEKLGKRKAVFTGSDYAYGREHAEMFRKGFESAGGKVVAEVFAPLATVDFGPYVTAIAKAVGEADVVHAVYAGTDGVRFVKTWAEFGMKEKVTLTNWSATTDGKAALDVMGADALGVYQISSYFLSLNTPANRAFQTVARQKTDYVDPMDVIGYLGGEVIARALEKVQGNVEDRQAFLDALRGVRFDAPSGPFRFDPRSQNAIVSLYIGRAERVGGLVRNVLIDTITEAQDPWWIEHGDAAPGRAGKAGK